MNAIATTTETLSAEARWNNALKEIRRAGVRVRQNISACCPGCVDMLALLKTDDETTPVAWTYGGQGKAYQWSYTGKLVRKNNNWHSVESVNFRHDNGSGPIIAAAFRANGFLVRWDGSEYKCVEVFPNGEGSAE